MAGVNWEFMNRVVPWPADDADQGFINLHWTFPAKDGEKRDLMTGRPYRRVDDFMGMIVWLLEKTNAKDMYFCLSRQTATRLNKAGKVVAAKSADTASLLKAVWLDVDVGKEGAYASIEEALAAIASFVQAKGLPAPSALIKSGGGIHVYWFSHKPLTVHEWRLYANGLRSLAVSHGLKCDAGLTTDCARILRPPGTWNCKLEHKRPVEVLGALGADYDFAADLVVLAEAPEVTATVTHVEHAQHFDPAVFPKKAWDFPEPHKSWREDELLNPSFILSKAGCPWLRNALKYGGKDYAQPQWNLTTLCSTFFINGREIAHAMSKDHVDYDEADTDDLFDRKMRERQDKGLGWPKCTSIQAAGALDCANCPHFSKGLTPLHLSPPPPQPTSLGALDEFRITDDLPDGYGRDAMGVIGRWVFPPGTKKSKDGLLPEPILQPLFYCVLTEAWAQENPDALNFTTTVSKGVTRAVHLKPEDLCGSSAGMASLLRQGVKPIPSQKKKVEDFFMSWLAKLHEAQRAMTTPPLGWVDGEDGKPLGFSFGGVIFMRDGSQRPAGMASHHMRKVFKPTGHLNKWMAACNLVTDRKQPELEALVLVAFAAPLMRWSRQNNCILSVIGEGGAGKTTAMDVGLSVWGHPKEGKDVFQTTERYSLEKMGALKNLPIFWDEVQGQEVQEKCYKMTYQSTQGATAGRLNQRGEMKETFTYQLAMAIASNTSFQEYVAKRCGTTDAGVSRVLEYFVERAPGTINGFDASVIIDELQFNYGVMGMRYAKLLMSDPDRWEKLVEEKCKSFAAEVQSEEGVERFWRALCGAILAGAELANLLGCKFNTVRLREFLVFAFLENRAKRIGESLRGGTADNAAMWLAKFFNEFRAETIWTDITWLQRGRPPDGWVSNPLFTPPLDRGRPLSVHWSVRDRLLRINRDTFRQFVEDAGGSPRAVVDGLKKLHNAVEERAPLAQKTAFQVGRLPVIEIKVQPGSELEEMLLLHAHREDYEFLGLTPQLVPAV